MTRSSVITASVWESSNGHRSAALAAEVAVGCETVASKGVNNLKLFGSINAFDSARLAKTRRRDSRENDHHHRLTASDVVLRFGPDANSAALHCAGALIACVLLRLRLKLAVYRPQQ